LAFYFTFYNNLFNNKTQISMKQVVFSLLIVFFSVSMTYAQSRVTGKVTDVAGEALIGASVTVKENPTVGTITDIDGMYEMVVPSGGQTLVFSYTGYNTKEMAIGGASVVNISLEEGKLLDEVVVTALGIRKDKSNIGYSVGQVNEEDLKVARATNLTNSLVGKIAGVRTTGSGGSFTGSSIIVRGFTTFLGSNQPLMVVDGIPIDNSGGNTPLQAGSSLSNRAIDINQEDIESISVLKGAGATTLYGSRGAAGVILITTKKGKKNQKNSVNYNVNFAFQEVNRMPDYQNTYGQGVGGNFNATAISSWGPRMDGRRVALPAAYQQAGVGDSVAFVAHPDNVADLFRRGSNMQHNLSFQGGTDKSSYRLSLGYLDDQGVLDNNRLKRYNVTLNSNHEITSRLTAGLNVTYSNNSSQRTLQGNQLSNPLFRSWFTPRSWDLTGLPYQDAAGNQLHYDPIVDNPYWTIYNNLNDDNIDRVIGNINLRYKLNSWINAEYKLGVDNFSYFRSAYDQIGIRGGGSTQNGPTGGIREFRDIVRNMNSFLSITGQKSITDDLEMIFLIGQETVSDRRHNSDIIGRNLIVRDLRNLSTNTTAFNPTFSIEQRRIIGLLGNLTTIYKNFATLDLSLRNDWNSTLPQSANSYLYYSAAVSVNLLEAVPSLKSDNFNELKLRSNYGRTGKGGDFLYATDSYFSSANPADGFGPNIQFPFNGLAGYTLNNTAGNPELRPEFTNSFEVGFDLSLFKNRLKFDVTKYWQNTTDVIFSVPNSSAAGISAVFLNAGELNTDGWEVGMTVVPVQTKNFTWTTNVNFTQYQSIVGKLATGVQNIFLGGFVTPNIRLVEGEEYGQIYGNDYLRDDQGRMLLTAAGLPRVTPNVVQIGNPNPDFTVGINNNFSYRGFNLNVLLDIKEGGDIYSRNLADLQRNGVTSETAEFDRFNADGTVSKPYIFEGVLPDGTENLASNPNAVRVTAEQYWGNSGKFLAARGFIFDASWFRVREAALTYSLPKKVLKNTFLGNVEVGIFGRNLFLHAPGYPHLDPEQNALGINNAQGLEFNALPQMRSFGANLNVTF
jgi:TonB-linked SusC/RagA family outer membrane protein